MDDIRVVSAMICWPPTMKNGRLIVSAALGDDDPLLPTPKELLPLLTDDLGNPRRPAWTGDVQLPKLEIEALVYSMGLMVFCRAVRDQDLAHVVGIPPKHHYVEIVERGRRLGWDICSGNGWLPASAHGIFPIDPVSGESLTENGGHLNRFALFDDLDQCLFCKEENDKWIPEHSPWFPVAVYVSNTGASLLEDLFQNSTDSNS
jgi:hypothetical protein